MDGSVMQLLLEDPMLQVVLRLGCVSAGRIATGAAIRGWRALSLGPMTPGLLHLVTEVTQGPCGLTSPSQDSQWPWVHAASGKDIPGTPSSGGGFLCEHSHTLCIEATLRLRQSDVWAGELLQCL